MKLRKIIKRIKCELMYRKAKAAALKASSKASFELERS